MLPFHLIKQNGLNLTFITMCKLTPHKSELKQFRFSLQTIVQYAISNEEHLKN